MIKIKTYNLTNSITEIKFGIISGKSEQSASVFKRVSFSFAFKVFGLGDNPAIAFLNSCSQSTSAIGFLCFFDLCSFEKNKKKKKKKFV